MRVVLDTNILVPNNAWEDGKFTLLTCAEHLVELRDTLQKPITPNLPLVTINVRRSRGARLVSPIRLR